MRRAIFLDRDGVINKPIIIKKKPKSPCNLKQFKLLPKIKISLKGLKKLKYLIFIVSNQPDIGNLKISWNFINKINNYLMNRFPIDNILICPHTNRDKCRCRKPLPGMIIQLAKKYKINLKKSFVIGDRWKDIVAGKRANCKTILINYNYCEKKIKSDYKVKSLYKAYEIIKSHQ
jgi:D-glycero-D-manno-heptose 1,7-bisphosphate phosphatase